MFKVAHASTTRHEEWGGPKRWVRIILHDNVGELQIAARKLSLAHVLVTTVGCYHAPTIPTEWDEKRQRVVSAFPNHYAGTIRLCRPWLNNDTVVHECVHAASMVYRMDIPEPFNIGVHYNPREEHLAYIVGDLANNVFAAIKEIE